VKVLTVVTSKPVLDKMFIFTLPSRYSYYLALLSTKVTNIVKEFEIARKDVFDELSEGATELPSDKKEEFNRIVNEIVTSESSLTDADKVTLPMSLIADDFKLSATEMVQLLNFININPGE